MEEKYIYRQEMDGLRALAIIAVIVNHYNRDMLPAGYLGVDIFFVISGYVITSAIMGRKNSSFGSFILDFYQRRVKRLFPALILCVLITSLIGFLFIPPSASEYNTSWKTGITALFGLSNIYMLINSVDYFGNTAEFNLFSQTWSLGVEEQFYLLFPAFVWCVTNIYRDSESIKRLLYLIAVISIVSLILFLYLSREDDAAAFYLMPSRVWELGSGCLVFLICHNYSMALEKVKWVHPWILMVLLLLLLFFPLKYDALTAILVVFLTSLIITFIRPSLFLYRILTLPLILYLGLISYSLYLWHWSVLVISRWTIGLHWWSFPLQLGLTVLIAAVTYHYIERPLRYRTWSSARSLTIVYGFMASIICALLLGALGLSFKGALYTGSGLDKSDIFTLDKTAGISGSEPFIQMKKKISLQKQQCNMTPQYLSGKDYQQKPLVDKEFFSRCLSDSMPKIMLLGDSFASVFSTHVALAAKEIGYEFKMVYGYGCPYPFDKRNIHGSIYSRCDVDSAEIQDGLLESINQGDIVVIRLYFAKTQYIRLSRSFLDHEGVSAYDKEIESIYHAVISRGGSLLLIGSNPTLELAQPCFDPQWFNSLQKSDCRGVNLGASIASDYALRHDKHLVKKYSHRYPDFEVIAPTLSLCDESLQFCPAKVDGINMYVDKQHIGNHAVDLIYPELISALVKLSANK